MIEPQRARAFVVMKLLQLGRHLVDLGAELERRADRVIHMQGLALVRHLDPAHRKAALLEIVRRAREIVISEHAQPDAPAHGRASLAPDGDAVMRALLEPAQVERVISNFGSDEAEHVRIESAARLEVARGEDNVARARDVERRMRIGDGKSHAAYQ